MEVVLLVLALSFIVYWIGKKEAVRQKRKMSKISSGLDMYEVSITQSWKKKQDKVVKGDYYRKAKELGHSDKEIEAFWRDFEKGKNDNRFLKNLESVRAKYVR